MVKRYWIFLAALVLYGSNLGAMQGQLFAGSKKVLSASCKVAKTTYAYAVPVTIGGVASLAVIYKTFPASRSPIGSAVRWVGKKCYNAYTALCYEMQVRPQLDENNRREAQLRLVEQQNERDGQEIRHLINCSDGWNQRNQQLINNLKNVKVSSAMVHSLTGQVNLVARVLENFAGKSREGLGQFNTQLGTAVSFMERLKISGENIKASLQQPMPLSFQEKALAICPFAATKQALDERDEQSNAVLISLKNLQQGSELSSQQLQEIIDRLPELLKKLGIEPAE